MRVLGHPLHPALVHFPLALLLSATFADLVWAAGLTRNTQVGAVMMAAELAAALPAMIAGMVDFAGLDQAVVPHALRHMAAVGVAWTGYAIALFLRKGSLLAGDQLATTSIVVSIGSALVLALGGWLGGRLVYTYGAGVERAKGIEPSS